MISPFVFPSSNDLLLEVVSWEEDTSLLHLRSSQAEGTCPGCHQVSRRVHSHYMRTLADVPCQAQMVRLHLQVRRFFCDEAICSRKTFAEQFPTLALPYARRTERLANVLREVAFALGGKPGACLAKKLQMPTSLHTLLRLIRRSPCPDPVPPRVVGIDEWAWRKGRRYGTILCDLERHIPLDLLPDREAHSVIAWLKAHPSVEIVSRDRSTEYADAARQGAPQALQVVDRFHLVKNLGDALEAILDRNKGCLRFTGELGPNVQKDGQASLPPSPVLSQIRPALSKKAEKVRLARRQERLQRYERAIALREQGFNIAEIATRIGVHRRTIERFLAAPDFPEKRRRRAERTKLEAYHSYLWQRWQAGVHNASHLFRELTTLGYQGSYASVNKYLVCLRTGARLPATPLPPAVRTLTVKQVRFLFLRSPTNIQTEERQDLEKILARSTDLALIYHLVQQFQKMLHHRCADQLEDWVQQVLQCSCPELHRFVSGLRKDWKAVVAAFSLEWNNGMVEGHVNRLKLIKRQMYGRAAFDLLRRRVLHCA